MRRLIIPVVLGLLALAAPSALAAAPTASTLPATNVSSTGAKLNGSVVPNGEATSYFFEYGPSTAYGLKTSLRSASKGTVAKQVNRSVNALAPSTTYHFRLVATNASGTIMGADVTFTTPAAGQAPPTPTVTVLAVPNPSIWGKATTVTGSLAHFTTNGGQTVQLRENVYPYSGGFTVAGTVASDANGKAAFVRTPVFNTLYQVVVTGPGPDIASNTYQQRVRPLMTFYASDTTPRRGQRVRFRGSVVPGHDGRIVYIQRRGSTGRYSTVARARLVPVPGATRSTYRRTVRIYSSATYRAYLRAHEDHTSGLKYRTLKVH